MADGFISVGQRLRIFVLVRQIDNGRPEDRPISGKLDSPAQSDFLTIPQVLYGRIDIAVEPQIAQHEVGLVCPECCIDFVSADRQIVLVKPVAMGEADKPFELDRCASDNVRCPAGQAGSVGEDHGFSGQPIALPDIGL